MFFITFGFLILVTTFYNVDSKSSLTVLHAPKGVQFRNNYVLPVSKLKDILETILSFTVENGYDWRGFEMKNPFMSSAECLLVFHLQGPNELSFPHKTTLQLEEDDVISDIFSDISRDTELRFPDRGNVLLQVNMASDIRVFGSPDMKLSYNSTEDNFFDEIANLKNVFSQVITKRNRDGAPDVYWITLTKIAEKSLAPDDMELLRLVLNDLSETVSDIYNRKAFIAVITENQEVKIRSKRQTSAASNLTLADLNVADDYDEDFPVIFNIILWFSLALLFSLIAICMVIAGMDPGRDSIIYRMTSTRMKKDN